jgi:quercetin dioxygenase-like cupin family protein
MIQTRKVTDTRRFSGEKMQKVNLFETEHFFSDLYCLEPGQGQKVHAHKGADKVYFVLEGTARFHIGGEEQDLGAGHLVLAPADIDHGVRNDSTERLLLLVFMAPNPNR